MYTDYFRFREEPFNITPDPRFLYLTGQHREALDHLLYGIRQRKGFIFAACGQQYPRLLVKCCRVFRVEGQRFVKQ